MLCWRLCSPPLCLQPSVLAVRAILQQLSAVFTSWFADGGCSCAICQPVSSGDAELLWLCSSIVWLFKGGCSGDRAAAAAGLSPTRLWLLPALHGSRPCHVYTAAAVEGWRTWFCCVAETQLCCLFFDCRAAGSIHGLGWTHTRTGHRSSGWCMLSP